MTAKFSALALGGLLLLCGCGKQGPQRYDVSGTVTFQGKPVPAGQVIFDPDRSGGNDGLQGYAELRDGHYDTRRSDRGATAGPVLIRIEGFDGRVVPNRPYGKPLFIDYRVRVNLPQQDTTLDFEVPASAAKGVSKYLALPPE
jgi:hypothetical protein